MITERPESHPVQLRLGGRAFLSVIFKLVGTEVGTCLFGSRVPQRYFAELPMTKYRTGKFPRPPRSELRPQYLDPWNTNQRGAKIVWLEKQKHPVLAAFRLLKLDLQSITSRMGHGSTSYCMGQLEDWIWDSLWRPCPEWTGNNQSSRLQMQHPRPQM